MGVVYSLEVEGVRYIEMHRGPAAHVLSAAKCAYSTVILRIYRGFHHGLRHLATNYGERHAFSAMHNLFF